MLNNYPTEQTTKLPEKSYFNKVLILLIIIIFVLFCFIVYAAYLLNKKGLITSESFAKRAVAAYLPKEPNIIYRRSGTITEIRANSLKVQSVIRTTSYDPTQAYTTQILTLSIDASTVYTKRDFRDFNQNLIIPPSQASSLAELRVGDTIQFRSNVNIKNLTAFYVTNVEKIIR